MKFLEAVDQWKHTCMIASNIHNYYGAVYRTRLDAAFKAVELAYQQACEADDNERHRGFGTDSRRKPEQTETVEELKAKIETEVAKQVSVFSEEEFPVFSQGGPVHELQELATAELCNDIIKSIKTRNRNLSVLQCWWAMLNVQEEWMGTPIPEDTIILNFMGSGASCHVTAKQLNAALEYTPTKGDAACKSKPD